MAILTSVRWYFTVVLICISVIIMMLRIFSYAYWPCVCLFLRNVYLGLCAYCLIFFFFIESCELSVYFGNWVLVNCTIWKYFLPVHRLILDRLPVHKTSKSRQKSGFKSMDAWSSVENYCSKKIKDLCIDLTMWCLIWSKSGVTNPNVYREQEFNIGKWTPVQNSYTMHRGSLR